VIDRAKLEELVNILSDRAFDCGEWTKDQAEVTYEEANNRCARAKRMLIQYVLNNQVEQVR
jgi:hypothetical protein